MSNAGGTANGFELGKHGIRNLGAAHINLGTAPLLEHAIRRNEGLLAANGAFSVNTGQFTGRSPKDKFIVRDDVTESSVHWGAVNQPMTPEKFGQLFAKVQAFLQGREVYIQDCHGGADPAYALPIRV